MEEECPICLESLPTNYCLIEICTTCRKAFNKNCLYPDNNPRIKDCPHCRSNFFKSERETISDCLKILEDKDYQHRYYIHYVLGTAYEKVDDLEKAFYHVEIASDNGVSCAQHVLSRYYKEKDLGLSKEYFTKALENKCSSALYEESRKMNLNYKELLFEAADMGLSVAQYTLATISLITGEMSKEEVVLYLQRSLTRGYIKAAVTLGEFFSTGMYGFEIDTTLAFNFYSISGKHGDIESCYWLGDYHLANDDIFGASLWFKTASDKGDEIGTSLLAKCYFEMSTELGLFVRAEAFRLLNSLIDKEFTPALYDASFIYYNGEYNIEKDYEKAFDYMERASSLGYPAALEMLAKYYKEGVGCEIDLEKSEFYSKRYRDIFLL